VQNERSKSKLNSRSPLLQTPEVESQKAHDGFSLVEKVLIVDSRSALVAYLKCHYFLSRCSWRLRNLEGLSL